MAQDSGDICVLDFCIAYSNFIMKKEKVIFINEIGAKILVQISTFDQTWKSNSTIIYNWEKSKTYIYETAVPDETLHNINFTINSLRISEKN